MFHRGCGLDRCPQKAFAMQAGGVLTSGAREGKQHMQIDDSGGGDVQPATRRDGFPQLHLSVSRRGAEAAWAGDPRCWQLGVKMEARRAIVRAAGSVMGSAIEEQVARQTMRREGNIGYRVCWRRWPYMDGHFYPTLCGRQSFRTQRRGQEKWRGSQERRTGKACQVSR